MTLQVIISTVDQTDLISYQASLFCSLWPFVRQARDPVMQNTGMET